MTSPIADEHAITGLSSAYKNGPYSCAGPANHSFAFSSSDHDPSNLMALSMINQAFHMLPQNHPEKQPQISSLQFPDVQQMSNNKIGNIVTPMLLSEYEKIKQMIDKSGLLSPNQNLVTKNRGDCFWSNCFYQSDIEENFKKHMIDCHQLTSSALAQLEISLEKSVQLSNLLIKEQNHLYNMLLHLDQKMKSLPSETSVLTDYHYLSLLLNKFKQESSMLGCILDPDVLGGDISPQMTQHSNNCLPPRRQHSPILSKANISQQLMENLSSALMRSKPIDNQPQTTNFQHAPFAANHISPLSHSFNGNLQSVVKPDVISPNANNLAIYANSNNSPIHQPTNNESNLRDILSQPRSPNSSDAHLATTAFKHIKDKRGRSLHRKTPDAQGQLPKSICDRDYYRQYAVRPSASYVNLIKAAILESPRNELSLNEIYVWMQAEFAYFRDREQKWKNAIRHNLSLHKCFQRKHGKLWTFNENEYNLKKSRNRFQYNNVQAAGSEITDGEGFDEDDGHDEDGDRAPGFIKKERDYNEERCDETVLDSDQWSNYLHKNLLKTNSSSLDMPLLPSLRTDLCPSNSSI